MLCVRCVWVVCVKERKRDRKRERNFRLFYCVKDSYVKEFT